MKISDEYPQLASLALDNSEHRVVPGRWDSVQVERPWAHRIPSEFLMEYVERVGLVESQSGHLMRVRPFGD